MVSAWTLLAWALLTLGNGLGVLASALVAAGTGRRVAKSFDEVDTEPREVAAVAAAGMWSGATQLAGAICRHYWPLALILALLFRRCRQVVLVVAVVEGIVDWSTRNRTLKESGATGSDGEEIRIGLFAYLLLKRLDDIAYGLGLWTGVVRERHLGALRPQIRT